jgi:two-component system cell cycle sensor histidine kinase/response regulator CckA
MKRVLVVDDEEVLGSFICRILDSAGFRAAFAATSHAAIAAVEESLRSEKFSAALLDLNLAGETGEVLAAGILKLDPELPLIATTGLVTSEVLGNPGEAGFAAALRKPFGRDALLSVISGNLR